jgi:hypothetical protein
MAVMVIAAAPAAGPGSAPLISLQEAQSPLRIPDSDVSVEVVAALPVSAQLNDLTRLLGRRHRAASFNRTYPPTILELITLVERNPAKPSGRSWNSIRELTIGFDPDTRRVVVEYCLDYCDRNPKTGALHPRRKMVSYQAPEQLVAARLTKKIQALRKYDER